MKTEKTILLKKLQDKRADLDSFDSYEFYYEKDGRFVRWDDIKKILEEDDEECGEEKGYDEVVSLKCEFGYDHSICKDCMKAIKKKANLK